MTDASGKYPTGRIPEEPRSHFPPPSSEFGKQLRKVFEAKEGYSFIATDYTALEIRVYTSFMQDLEPCKVYPRRYLHVIPVEGGRVEWLGPVIKSKEEEPK